VGRYLLQRLLLAVPTLLGVSILVFIFIRLLPGGAAAMICGLNCSNADVLRINHALGLDAPLPTQYVHWVANLLHGNLGVSILTGQSISGQLREKLPVTFELGLIGMLTGLLIAVPVGIVSAVRQDSILDYAGRIVAVGLLAIPSFWLAILLIALGSRYGFWTPSLNYVDFFTNPLQNLGIVLLPGILLGAGLSGTMMRLTRAQMLEVLRQDYVRTAHAKGLDGRAIVVRHALRNALLPLITIAGSQVPVLVGGSVILETVFSIPGMGRYIVDAVTRSDLPVIQAVNLIVALIVILSNIVVDVAYTVIDPRVRI
jgi:peptide/nickel transport system permease protein